MDNQPLLEGKVVVVTGAGRGIGRDIALLCARKGARIVVNDLGASADGEGFDAGPAEEVLSLIRRDGGSAVVNGASVADPAGATSIVEDAIKNFGAIHGVVNNAGILRDRILHKMSLEDWKQVIDVHLTGSFLVSKAAAPYFKDQASGSFVHFTSTSGLIGNFGQANYSAAKMGIWALSNSIALDKQRFGIRSNCIAPFAWSRLIATIAATSPAEQLRIERMKTMTTEKIAPMVAALLSGAAAGVSGQTFGVRKNEAFVFSKPRPVRTMHRGKAGLLRRLSATSSRQWRMRSRRWRSLPIFGLTTRSEGIDMPLDPDKLLALPSIETRQKINAFKVMLYALGIGAEELQFVYEGELEALPMMAVTLAYPGFIWRDPALGVTWQKILHGETSVVLHAPVPLAGEVRGISRFGPIFDKGASKGAVVYQTREIYAEDETHIATVRNATFLRADGGYGGTPGGQSAPRAVPDRIPDISLALPTATNQALLYRLSGDMNPLHADPKVSHVAGFPRPILHGLATFGVAGRALLKALVGNDTRRFRRMDVRFAKPVFPGESIVTDIWHEAKAANGNSAAAWRCRVADRNAVVLTNGYLEFR